MHGWRPLLRWHLHRRRRRDHARSARTTRPVDADVAEDNLRRQQPHCWRPLLRWHLHRRRRRDHARSARTTRPVDADGAEDNHARAAPSIGLPAVVALRALNCRARLPDEPGARQFTAPHRPYRFRRCFGPFFRKRIPIEHCARGDVRPNPLQHAVSSRAEWNQCTGGGYDQTRSSRTCAQQAKERVLFFARSEINRKNGALV
jgi:hypothetical protein